MLWEQINSLMRKKERIISERDRKSRQQSQVSEFFVRKRQLSVGARAGLQGNAMNSILDMYEQQYSSSRENDIVGSLEAICDYLYKNCEKIDETINELQYRIAALRLLIISIGRPDKMKRDFSESTKEQMVNLITNTDSLYSEDINSVDLFAPVDSYDDDFILYRNEIYDEVQTANNYATTNYTDNLVGRLNQLVDEAKEIDHQHYTKVEEATANTVLGYIDDLNILADALSVKSLGKNKTDILEKLKYGNYSTIFDYKDRFNASVDTKLYDRLYNYIVTEQGDNYIINYEILREIMQEESLTNIEIGALIKMFNEAFITDADTIADGALDYEKIEKFLECCYVLDGKGEVALHNTYKLSGAYYDLSAAYNLYLNSAILSYDKDLLNQEQNREKLPKFWYSIFRKQTSMNGILFGVESYYSKVYLPEKYEDGKEVYYDLEFSITNSDGGFISIEYGKNLKGYEGYHDQIKVYDYGELGKFRHIDEMNNYKQKINELQNYPTISEALFEFIFSEVVSFGIGLMHDDIAIVCTEKVFSLADTVVSASEKKDEIDHQIGELEKSILTEQYFCIIDAIDCQGTYVSCNGNASIINEYFYEKAVEDKLEDYNEYVNEKRLTVKDIWVVLYDPYCVDLKGSEYYADFLLYDAELTIEESDK